MENLNLDRVIVLGIDGIDPNILENLMDTGNLPNFLYLRETGTYRRLQTSNPAQSPVAWSTIATGNNPAYHGIFDFIIRNPINYLPELAVMKTNPRNIFARRDSMFLPSHKGMPFWSITSQGQVPTSVIKWPITFPPEEISGHMLSGLGVPDLKGFLGRYAFYTTGTIPKNEERKGDIIHITSNSETIETIILGPNNSRIPMKIRIDDENSRIRISIGSQSYIMNEREWSDWISLRFNISFLRHITGICRFYLCSVKPELELYLSPIHVDPKQPAFLISYPDKYATQLADNIGNYHTLGMPEDTNALNDECFDEETFLKSCEDIMAEREKMLWYELDRFKKGLLAFVFDTTDRIQHIFWSTRDPNHPTYNEKIAKKYRNVIKHYYKCMDKILGRVLGYVDEKMLIIVLSDHGFVSFRRAVNLNSWLVQNGLMVLKKIANGTKKSGLLFKNVDWRRTKAYALGFTGIYLNLREREENGIINPGEEAGELRKRITDALVQLKDPKANRLVVKGVYNKEDLYRGPYTDEAPDLIVGFQPGYRASWQTAIGGTPEAIFEDNLKKWSGDHLVDPYFVPGIFLINRRISASAPSVIDIAPTILECFQIPKPQDMEGNSLLD